MDIRSNDKLGNTALLLCVSLGICLCLSSCEGHNQSSSRQRLDSETAKIVCQRQLRTVAFAIDVYRVDHEEKMPTTLEQALEEQAGTNTIAQLVRCPAGIRDGAFSKYRYINWSLILSNVVVPNDFPLVYEAQRGLHGDGVNVVRMDQTVFWDAKGEWLARFAAEHPDFKLTLPR